MLKDAWQEQMYFAKVKIVDMNVPADLAVRNIVLE